MGASVDSVGAFLVVGLITFYGVIPVLILIHELGHARALIRAGKRPLVLVGRQPAAFHWKTRRLEVRFDPRLPLQRVKATKTTPGFVRYGVCVYDSEDLTVQQLRSISAAGPHASVVAAVAAAAVAWLIGDPGSALFWGFVITAFSAWNHAFRNLIPSRSPHFTSDGGRMARLRGLDHDLVMRPSRFADSKPPPGSPD